MPKIVYENYFSASLALIEKTLDQCLPASEQPPNLLHEAMRYSVFPGGKRFRAVLAMAACEACGKESKVAAIPAASLELIHCYSLVHDDLPALDNDDLRRGKPTCHKKYGEAMGVLTGDGLLTLAFQILAKLEPSQKAVELLAEISTSSGTYGMIGGQVADLMTKPEDLSLPMLDFINVHKTGKLIKASAVSGAIAAGANNAVRNHILKYGECLGLAFQAVDDLSDGDGYLKLMKAPEVRENVRTLIAQAKREIKPLGQNAKHLLKLADFLLGRMPKGNHDALDS